MSSSAIAGWAITWLGTLQIWPEFMKNWVRLSTTTSRSASCHTTQQSLPASSRIGFLPAATQSASNSSPFLLPPK